MVNENENPPQFSRAGGSNSGNSSDAAYEFEVEENSAPGPLTTSSPPGLTAITVMTRVTSVVPYDHVLLQATDADSGIFGDITYTLIGFGVPQMYE